MAYIDVASQDSYGRFNIKFASIVGLNTAVYWSAIMNVLEKVKDKKTYDEEGFFTLDRSYIERKTTLSKELQLESDKILESLGIVELSKDRNNKLRCNVKNFIELIVSEKVTAIKAIKVTANKISKEGQKEAKRAGIISRLKGCVKDVESDLDLQKLYSDWVEVCYDRGVWRKPQVDSFINSIRSYSKDKNIQMKIINIAIARVYKDASWAIEIYVKQNPSKLGEQKIVTEIDSSKTF